MRKNVFIAIGALLVAGGLVVGIGMISRIAQAASADADQGCPPDYVQYVVLDLIQPGEESSQIVDYGCRPVEVETVVLDPLSPKERARPDYQPTETNPIVRGPSDSDEYRCVVVLEPLEEGGGASDPVCGRGRIEVDQIAQPSAH